MVAVFFYGIVWIKKRRSENVAYHSCAYDISCFSFFCDFHSFQEEVNGRNGRIKCV